MATLATRSDALRLSLSGTDIIHLDTANTIPGVYISAIAAANGIGTAHIKGDGSNIQWKAPGSSVFGVPVSCTVSSSEYLLEDGDDRKKWVRIIASTSYFADVMVEGKVLTRDMWANAISHDDVTSGEASAGDVVTHQVNMDNDSPKTLSGLVVWLDAAVSDLEISEDNAAFSSPTTEATALSFPDLAAAGSDILYVKRTITAGASADPDVLNHLHFRYWARF